jgi:hypothetical protein
MYRESPELDNAGGKLDPHHRIISSDVGSGPKFQLK